MKNTQNKLIVVFIVTMGLTSCSKDLFKTISEQVDSKQRQGRKTDKPTFHDVRMQVYKNNKAMFLKSDIDTLYILEEYSIEDAAYYGKIWNRKNNLVYKSQYGKIDYDINDPFTKFTSSLVHQWDTAGIRLEESHYSDMIPIQWLYGTRIIKQINEYKIDVIVFKKFFKVERDRSGSP